MNLELNQKYNIILASQSPRRQQLLSELGIEFNVFTKDNVDEYYPDSIDKKKIAEYLAENKAEAYNDKLIHNNDLIITADTLVLLRNTILGKPLNYQEAKQMLMDLSNCQHSVITGVCLKTRSKQKSFSDETKVSFKKLTNAEIDYYISNYKPYDKAGAYGIQEWIGYIGVKQIEGSYFNVMGLPVQKLYEELMFF